VKVRFKDFSGSVFGVGNVVSVHYSLATIKTYKRHNLHIITKTREIFNSEFEISPASKLD
jgi:hypothetical protein